MKPPYRLASGLMGAVLLTLSACSDGPSEAQSIANAKAAAAQSDYSRAHLELQNALQKNAYSGEARFLLGSILLAVEQPVLATVELRKALDQGHPAAVVSPVLARAMLKQGQAKAVVSEFAQVTLTVPEADADLKTTVAAALLNTGRKPEAESLLQAVLAARPGHPSAVLLKAQMSADAGDLTGALASVDALLKAEPRHVDAWRTKGDLQLYGQGDLPAAIDSYAKALAQRPGDPLSSKAIIFALLASGDLKQAEQRLAEMKRVLPNDVQARYFDAQLAYLRGDARKAKDLLEPVLKAAPDSSWTLVLAGAVQMTLGRWSQAEAHLARAVRLYPGLVNARVLLARTHLRGGDPNRAIAALESMLTPKSRPPLVVVTTAAEAYLLAGNPQRASELFDIAAKADPKAPAAQIGRARAMLARGDTDAAMAELVRLSSTDTGKAADLALISLQLQRGRMAEAGAAIDSLIQKHPDDPTGHKLRAEWALRQGKADEARTSFERCLKLDAAYFPAVAGLAALDRSQGNQELARSRFKTLLETKPNLLAAQLALARLEVLGGGQRDNIVGLLQAAIKAHPDDASPYLVLTNYLLSVGDARQALGVANQADRALQNHPDIMLSLARAQDAAGEPQQALATYGKAVSVRPNFADAYLGLGELQLRMKDHQAGAASFRRARQIQPDAVRATTGLVRAEMAAGRYDAALAMARDMGARRKDLPIGLMQEGDVELVRGRPAAAAVAYAAALKRPGASGSLATYVYDSLLRAGQRERAEAIAADWLRAHPDDLDFKASSGLAALLSGDVTTAETRFREVLQAKPQHVAALNNLAWLLASNKRPGAVVLAEQALALQPESPQVLDTLALALVNEGQLARAADMQLKAIQKRGGTSPSAYNLSLAKIYLAQGKKDQALTELTQLAALGDAFPAAAEVARLKQAASN